MNNFKRFLANKKPGFYVSNVAFGVDGNSFDAGFFTFVVTSILATIVAAVAFSMGISKSNKLLAPSEENN